MEPQRTAKPADISAAQCDEGAAQECWKEAKGPGGGPEESRLEPSEEWDDRGEVDIPQRRVASAVQVVELIGVKPKSAIGRKVKRKDARGSPSIKEHGCQTRTVPAERGVHRTSTGANLVNMRDARRVSDQSATAPMEDPVPVSGP